jgi:phage shock protein PspC (stress-responsive transcriptional regulator)
LLSEKITDARQVVNKSDIDNIIVIMGQPEDYSEAEETFTDANYSQKKNHNTGKKLFRDGDDKFLGGVAAGIAHYFNIDTIWIRLGLLALFFGGGFGIILYIILWILLPEAKTTAEKLQMEGEPVNIDNIEKKIRKEFDNVSGKIKEGANEFSEKINKTFSGKALKNNGLQDFMNTLGKIVLVFFKVISKFIGAILVFVAAAVILSLIISGFSLGSLEWLNVDGNFLHYPPFFYDAILPKWVLTLALFLLIGIPFLILFVLGLRILSSSIKQFTKATSLTFIGIWIVALLTLIFTGLDFGTSHVNYGQAAKKTSLNFVQKDSITLKMINDDEIYYTHNLKRNSDKHEVDIDGTSKTYSNNVKVDVKRSNSNEGYLMLQKVSRGKNSNNANKNAKKIEYKFEIINKTIVLDAYYLSDFKNFWKEEEIIITVYIPESTTVYFDNTVKNFLYRVDNETAIYDKDMANHHFEMTNETLKCTDCAE